MLGCPIVLVAGCLAATFVCTNDPVATRLEASAGRMPRCLSRFAEYPPNPLRLTALGGLLGSAFPLNPDFWLKDVDFTCASPWNDSCGCQCAGTAISRRHVIFAKHFPLRPGTRMAFVGGTGETSHYTVKATKALKGCDIAVGLLDDELTPDVHPAKVLPDGFEKRLINGSKLPVVTFNQREQAVLTQLLCVTNAESRKPVVMNRKGMSALWKKFNVPIVGGDSGNPAFLLWGGRPILLYCLQSGGAGLGPWIHERRDEVQGAMDELCPGYRLETFDFGD